MNFIPRYFKYACRALLPGGRYSFFVLLCVAVGVAVIVALQTSSFASDAALVDDARTYARADILVTNKQGLFNRQDLAGFEELEQNKIILDYTTIVNFNAQILKVDGQPSNSFGSAYSLFVIFPARYPFYGREELAVPSGKSLSEVLSAPGQIVLSDKMAQAVGAKVGDKLRANHDNTVLELEVSGILASKVRTPPVQAAQLADFTGYAFISEKTALSSWQPDQLKPDTVLVKTISNQAADEKARAAIEKLSLSFIAKTSREHNVQIVQSFNGVKNLITYVSLGRVCSSCH